MRNQVNWQHINDYTRKLELRTPPDEEPLTDEEMVDRAAKLKEYPDIKSIAIDAPEFSAHHARLLLDACRERGAGFTAVDLRNLRDADALGVLLDGLAAMPELSALKMTDCAVDDALVTKLASALEGHTKFNHLRLCRLPITEDGMLAVANILPTLPNLAGVQLFDSWDGTPAVEDALDKALLTNPNAMYSEPLSVYLDQALQRNKTAFDALVWAAKDRETLTNDDICKLAGYQPALEYMRREMETVRAYFDVQRKLDQTLKHPPTPARDEDLTPDWLTGSDTEHGLSPLVFPDWWEALPKIMPIFDTLGTPIKKEHLSRSPEGSEESFLSIGLRYGMMDQIQQVLTKNGEAIRQNELVSAPGHLTAFGEALVQQRQMGAIFQIENWVGASEREMRACFNALPDDAQAQVTNLHQLSAQLRREQHQLSR